MTVTWLTLFRSSAKFGKLGRSWVQDIRKWQVDRHSRPPAASLSWPDVCRWQMTAGLSESAHRAGRRKGILSSNCWSWQGFYFDRICSVTVVCLKKPDSLERHSAENKLRLYDAVNDLLQTPMTLCECIGFKESDMVTRLFIEKKWSVIMPARPRGWNVDIMQTQPTTQTKECRQARRLIMQFYLYSFIQVYFLFKAGNMYIGPTLAKQVRSQK